MSVATGHVGNCLRVTPVYLPLRCTDKALSPEADKPVDGPIQHSI